MRGGWAEETVGVGAGGISCQMCNKISLAGGQTLPLKSEIVLLLFFSGKFVLQSYEKYTRKL